MGTVLGFREIAESERDGFTFISGWRKQPTQTTGAGIWFDLSMSPGNPRPNNYIGPSGVFTPMSQSEDGGIPHGGNVSPKTKMLRIFEAQTATAAATPLTLHLLDYLGFYSFIDESDTDEQFLDNTIGLPRYTNGNGVQIMPVVVAPQVGGSSGFVVTYTNSNGVSDRKTPRHVITTQAINGTIASSSGSVADSRAPFMALQSGDTGVLRVDSIQFDGVGDIGLLALVLVKPIAKHYIRGINAPSERDYFTDDAALPVIQDDAYLNLLSLPAGNLSGAPIFGYIKTLWA